MKRWASRMVLGGGLLLVALHLLALNAAAAGGAAGGRLLACELAAGLVYLMAAGTAGRVPLGRREALVVLAIGVLLRLAAGLSPASERSGADARRYVADGGLLALGVNPYRIAPATAAGGQALNQAGAPLSLPPHAADWLAAVPDATRTSRLPPLALGLSAIAHYLSPWSTAGWRLLLTLADVGLVALLAWLLAGARLSPGLLLIYVWHPLVIRDVYGAGHQDVFTALTVMGGLALLSRQRPLAAAALLGLALGLQSWPLALLPLWLCPWRGVARRGGMLAIMGGLGALAWLPRMRWGWGPDAGWFHAIAHGQLNDGLFMLASWGVALLELPGGASTQVWYTRLLVLAVIGGLAVALAWRPPAARWGLWNRTLLAVAAAFLLSPVPLPWHAVPLVPLLVLVPRPSLLWLTTAVLIYPLRATLAARGDAYLYDYGLVWLPVVPALLLLAWESRREWESTPRVGSPPLSRRVAWESARRPFWARRHH